jgi:DNA invertase Pin-like site-specific DNA recombinase
MDRPGMTALLADLRAGVITQVVVWRLDRLGRTAKGLLQFFEEELAPRKVGFLSLRDAVDLSTPSGRLMLTILAAVAQFETEVRSERQRAGIETAKANNGGRCPWGGRAKGTRVKVSAEKETAVKAMYEAKTPVSEIARVIGLGRQTVYRVLGRWERRATA